MAHATIAKIKYRETKMWLNTSRAYREMARACVYQNPEQAKELLSKSMSYYEFSKRANKIKALERWYGVAFELAIVSGDKSKALSLAQERLYYVPMKNTNRGVALSDLAMGHIINGDVEVGREIMKNANKLLQSHSEAWRMYHKVTELALLRETGRDYRHIEYEIRSYSKGTGVQFVERRLDALLGIPSGLRSL